MDGLMRVFFSTMFIDMNIYDIFLSMISFELVMHRYP